MARRRPNQDELARLDQAEGDIRKLKEQAFGAGGSSGGITWTMIDPSLFVSGVTAVTGDDPTIGWDDDFIYFRGLLQTGFKTGPQFTIMQAIPIPRDSYTPKAAPILVENVSSPDPNVPAVAIGFLTPTTYMVGGNLVMDIDVNRSPTYGLSSYTAESFIFLSPAKFAWP